MPRQHMQGLPHQPRPFRRHPFGRRHEGLCLPGLGFKRYDDMASALCTAMPICLDKADGRVRAMVSGVETKTRNCYEIVWNLLFHYVPGFDPIKTVDKPRWDLHKGNVIQYAPPSTSISGSAPSAGTPTLSPINLFSS